ncbi:MAG: ATP-binding protein [Micrococcales bacterium]|nr:ATP-binding protein [Micrococcales bacterium]
MDTPLNQHAPVNQGASTTQPTLLPRNVAALASGALDRFPILAIQGARRVGKSTLATMLVADRPHVIASLDDEEQATLARQDPRGFLAQRGNATLVIDEVQRVPELILAVKHEVDRSGDLGNFILTGSSNITSSRRIPDSLAGRAITIRLGGLSQGEMAGVREDFVTCACRGFDEAAAESSWTREDYVDAVAAGGYPELRRLDGQWRALWADSYLDRLTSRDILDAGGNVAAPRVRAILGLVAANQAGELVKARLAAAADISERSVTTCLEALRSLHVTSAIPPWTANLTKRQIGRPKALVTDSGLATHLAGVEIDLLKRELGRTTLGPFMEGFVMAELLKQRTWSSTRWDLAHFRDRNGLEVDGVIQLADGRIILLEIKATQTYRSEHFAAMKSLQASLGDRLVAGVVLTLSDHSYRYADKLWGLPISALWAPTSP